MFILFDLDDTLIDTSGSILPYRFRQMIDFLFHKGLSLPSLEEAFLEIQNIAIQSKSTQEAIEKFLSIHQATETLSLSLFQHLEEPLPKSLKIKLCPGAKEILLHLHPFHDLALVTMGQEELQRQKWEKAGLDSSLFCKIIVVAPNDKAGKKRFYEMLVREKKYAQDQVVVCGDHIERDLIPAKQLGYRTVLMKWGKGSRWTRGLQNVDFAISHLGELKEIITHLEKREKIELYDYK